MPEAVARLVARYRQTGIVLDANLLVLLVVGLHDRARIATFKRTRQYTADDFDLLGRLIGGGTRITVTPGILTETSNLVGEARLPVLRALIGRVAEKHMPAARLAESLFFDRFGLTDAGIAELAGSHLILTGDFRLSESLRHRGFEVLNFNHLRTPGWP